MTGTWDLYWKFLINPDDWARHEYLYPPPVSQQVPGLWKGLRGTDVQQKGYGTYHLVITLNDKYSRYGLRIPRIVSAYKLWINGELIEQKGTVGTNIRQSRPEHVPVVKYLTIRGEKADILLQVSNYHSREGGVWEDFTFSTAEDIEKKTRRSQSLELFLMGCLVIMFFYHLGFSIMRPKDTSTLFFSILSLSIALRIGLTGESLLLFLYPSFPWALAYTLEYLLIIFIVLSLIGYFYAIFSELLNRNIIVLFTIFYSFQGLFILFSHTDYYAMILMPFFIVTIISFLYLLWVIMIGISRKNDSASLFLAGVLVLFGAAVNDILKALQVHYGPFIFHYGTVIFIFFQSILIARRMTHALDSVEHFSAQLEEKVSRRSLALFEKNRMIMESISYAKRIQLASMPGESLLREVLGDFFILWKPREIVGGDIYWFKKEENAFLLAVIDCTGHGVPGAFMTMMVNSILTKIIEHVCNDDPARILNELHNSLRTTLNTDERRLQIDDGLDMGLVYCAPEKGTFIFAGAKISLFYRTGDTVREIKGDRQSIGHSGSQENCKYTNHKVPLETGYIYYMTSDGFLDQCGGKNGLPLGRRGFKRILSECKELPLEEQKKVINQALLTYMKSAGDSMPQLDDITVVGFIPRISAE